MKLAILLFILLSAVIWVGFISSKSLVKEASRFAYAAGQCHAYENDNTLDRGKLCMHDRVRKDIGVSASVTYLFHVAMTFLSQLLLLVFLFLFIKKKPNKSQNSANEQVDASDDMPI